MAAPTKLGGETAVFLGKSGIFRLVFWCQHDLIFTSQRTNGGTL
jgi:hypothetical protein